MSSPPDGRLSSSFSPTEATIPQAKDSHSSRLPLRKKKAFYNVSSSAMAQANVATTLSNQTTDVQAVIKEKNLATSIHLDEKKNKQTSIKAASSSRGGSPNKTNASKALEEARLRLLNRHPERGSRIMSSAYRKHIDVADTLAAGKHIQSTASSSTTASLEPAAVTEDVYYDIDELDDLSFLNNFPDVPSLSISEMEKFSSLSVSETIQHEAQPFIDNKDPHDDST